MEYKKVPYIRTSLPGPKTQELLERDHRYISPSYTRAYPLVAHRARGVAVEDPDGNVFLDMTAGIAVCATGHCHPEVVEAIRDQAGRLIHMSGTDFYYEVQIRLAERLAELAPGDFSKRVFFSNSGAESVEAAIKLARYHTGRPWLISFVGAFHGRTMGALSLTNSKYVQRERFAPLLPQVGHIFYPYCMRCPVGRKVESCLVECLGYVEEVLFERTIPPRDVAAIIFEPVQGEGGYIVPPQKFVDRLKELVKRYGILLIADEVQSGMGRTGRMFACEHFGLEPDIICLAKGIASGMPLGATIASSEVMDWRPGSHASTFGGNPVSCAAALKTLDLLEGGLVENAREVGGYLKGLLEEVRVRHREEVLDVRGLGLMVAVELSTPKLAEEVYLRAFEKGLLLLPCGSQAIRFSPALSVSKEEVLVAVEIFESCLG